MFSGFELTVIKSWALSGQEILKGHLNSAIFTHAEKEDKRREYAALESIIETSRRIQTEYVSVDADHLGHIIFICDEYKHYVHEQCEDGNLSAGDYAAECYQIGYIQGRAEIGLLSTRDINVVDEWENALEASNQECSPE